MLSALVWLNEINKEEKPEDNECEDTKAAVSILSSVGLQFVFE
jgi:hypothetical protein